MGAPNPKGQVMPWQARRNEFRAGGWGPYGQGLRHADENGGDGDQAVAKPGFSSEGNPYQKPKTQRIWPTIFLKMGGLSPALSKMGGRVPPSPPVAEPLLTEKGPKRQKGPQSVCKNNKLPKNQHNASQKGPFLRIRVPQEMKFIGPGGGGGTGPSRFLQHCALNARTPGTPLATDQLHITLLNSRHTSFHCL